MTADLLSFTIEDEIKYHTKGGILIQDLITSLESLEALTKQSKKAFSQLLGIKVVSIDLRIAEVKEGSIIEKIYAEVKYYNENKENVDQSFKQFVQNNKMKVGFFGAVITGITAFGVYHYITTGDPNAVNVNVSGSYNNVIVNSAGAIGVPADKFKEIIEDSPTNRKTLSKSAIEFIQPAKKNEDIAQISFSGNNITIPTEFVKETPNEYIPHEDEKDLPLKDITLSIRSVDRDNYEKGWTAQIDGVTTKRLKLELPPTINLTTLSMQENVKADVTIFYTQQGDKINHKYIRLDTLYTK
ncbi:hypothetical protein [Avibacterium sp. 21-599]|uniref:hypothetical protein n=1 Tax=Avibacterium sp. 21-599 TaxID=2911528 RepID=UPI002247C044|nr:hypothetical protein [Avibacterium sp. 21-599]MCW9717369.1 hypothetical protein [Avibacterium sp. 21-599]